ncbi:MAG: carboxylesterase family protein [Candidatus Marinimicrobia bacterium]|nr:carboxylesterase family protein [Candidatus Neomarinimicrobiota bacterium]
MNYKLILPFIYLLSGIFTQTRYIDEVFDNIYIDENVVYGNAPDLPFWFLLESNTVDVDLDMDMYFPENEYESNRPLIIVVHGGAFFSGDNNLDDVTALSISAAKRGYVVANINYRLGLNVLDQQSCVRAIYRGTQDGSAVVRHFRENYSEYGIDPEKIYMWGSSAGAFIAHHLAFMDDDDRPSSTYGGFGIPDLGCLDCEGNSYNHSRIPNAIIGCWGALLDLNYIDANDSVPTLMFHGTVDLVVPIETGLAFTAVITLPIVHGSGVMAEHLEAHSVPNILVAEPGQLHEYWGVLNGTFIGGEPSQYWEPILETGFNFLYDQFSSEVIGDVNEDGVVNVIDVVQMVQFILNGEFNPIADMNNDGSIDVLDVVILVNQILGES